MGRAASDDLDDALVLQFAKGVDQIAAVAVIPEVQRRCEIIDIHLGDIAKLLCLGKRALELFAGKLEQIFEVACVALLQ